MVGWLPWLSIEIGISPTAIGWGPLDIRWYGIAYVVAIAVGIWFAVRYMRERGMDEEMLWDIAPWAILSGFVGGRLYYVVQNDFGSYLRDPIRIIEVWNGGMAFFGAIIAVAGFVVIWAYVKKLPLAPMLDVAAFFALIGQPIGRLGNIVNGDVLGPQTDLPWGFIYTHPDSFAPDAINAYHPAAAYAIIDNLVLIAILFPLRKKLAPGWMMGGYLAGYCISQLIVFIWRSEPTFLFGLQQAQWTAIALLAIEALVLAWWWQKRGGPFQDGTTPVPTRASTRAARRRAK